MVNLTDTNALADKVAADVAELADQFGVPGAAFGADVAGERILVNHGVTHLDHQLPVDSDTLFQIASMSKPFTATLVMTLVDEGSIGLDDRVIDHVPDLATPEHRHDAALTIRHLLTHTAGWDGDHLLVHPIADGRLADAPPAMESARQLVPPGTHWTYSNAGYAVAGALVEVVTGQTYEAALRTRILDRLNMGHTAVNADEAIMHRVAMRHETNAGIATPLYDAGWQPGWGLDPIDLPVGGMISTTNDLLTWLECWLDRGQDDALTLSRSTRSDMCSDQVGFYNPTSGQGIGWAIRVHNGHTIFGHGGLTAGYCSYSMFSPELDLAAVILTNSTTGTALCMAVIERLISHVSQTPMATPEPDPTRSNTSGLAGRYAGAFGVITVEVEGAELVLTTERHPTSSREWQPEPEPPRRAGLYTDRHAVVVSPAASERSLVDFAHGEAGAPAPWIRSGGRIHTRISA